MAIPWVMIAEGVLQAYQAYQERESAQNDRNRAQQSIRRIIAAIDQAKREIINEINDTRLHDLEGDVNGIITNLREYHIYDRISELEKWRAEGERLRSLIDNAAGVVGDLVAILRATNYNNESHFNLAVKIYPLYTDIVFFRSVAMVERTYTYGINDAQSIPPMIEELKTNTRKLHDALRQRSDERFGQLRIVQHPHGEGISLGWDFNGNFQECDWSIQPASLLDREKCKKERQSHMNEEFKKYPGAGPVLSAKSALNI